MRQAIVKSSLKFFTVALFFWITPSFADGSRFEIRADGLACPYCAYGIEKKFMQIKGVKKLDIDLKKGIVIVIGEKDLTFKEEQLKTLFTDSGFTFRKFKKTKIKE